MNFYSTLEFGFIRFYGFVWLVIRAIYSFKEGGKTIRKISIKYEVFPEFKDSTPPINSSFDQLPEVNINQHAR